MDKSLDKLFEGKDLTEYINIALNYIFDGKTKEEKIKRSFDIENFLNKKFNNDDLILKPNFNNHSNLTLSNSNWFVVPTMYKENEKFGIKPANFGKFIEAEFIGRVAVGGQKNSRDFKIVEVKNLSIDQLEELEELAQGYNGIYKKIEIINDSLWFRPNINPKIKQIKTKQDQIDDFWLQCSNHDIAQKLSELEQKYESLEDRNAIVEVNNWFKNYCC